MAMKAIASGLRCIRSSHTPRHQQLSRRLLHLRQKPVTLLYQHGRAIAPVHPSSALVTSIFSATTKRNYASDPLSVQTGDDSPKTIKANDSVDSQPSQPNHVDKDQVPAYDLTFTCKKCLSRSTHRVSKQGFYKGTVLITCPGCKNRHLISDHLKIFSDKPVTIEDLMRDKGQLVRKGNLNSDGDVEFWDTESVGTNEIKNKPME